MRFAVMPFRLYHCRLEKKGSIEDEENKKKKKSKM